VYVLLELRHETLAVSGLDRFVPRDDESEQRYSLGFAVFGYDELDPFTDKPMKRNPCLG
jgi:hypothetical protein